MLHYINDDLFNAPSTQLLVHACNCQGVWGSGIAKEFKRRFPNEFVLYNTWTCVSGYVGTSLIINRIGCLFTSKDFGLFIDPPEFILANTEEAMKDLLNKTTMDLAMPKINSGLFKVPWEDTEKILKQFNRDIYIYDPSSK